jgi:hypothetical protein
MVKQIWGQMFWLNQFSYLRKSLESVPSKIALFKNKFEEMTIEFKDEFYGGGGSLKVTPISTVIMYYLSTYFLLR